MLYYLVKYRFKITFCFVFILGIVIAILTGIINKPISPYSMYLVVCIDALLAFGVMCISLMHYNSKGYNLILNNLKKILKKYSNKPKQFKFFYKEYVQSNIIHKIDSIIKLYKEKGRTYPTLCFKLNMYKSISKEIHSYDEAIKGIAIHNLLVDHLKLAEEFFEERTYLEDELKKVFKEKEDKLVMILKEEIDLKSKELEFGEYYN